MARRRTFSKTGPMDQWLESQGFYRKHTAHDGSCLFRAFAEQLFNTQSVHQNVRQQCVEFMKKNKETLMKFFEGDFEEHVTRMGNSRELGGQLEIQAMSLLYSCEVVIFEEMEQPPRAATDYGFERKVLLCRSADEHYDSVYTKDYVTKVAFCQSIAYEVLYKNVFKFSDIEYAVEKMLHDKSSRLQREKIIAEDRLLYCGRYRFNVGITFDENEIDGQEEPVKNVKEILAHGATPFPYKVAKALDPNIYRNIEFDIWNDYRKEVKYGWYRNNGELQVGVKCLVKLEPERMLYAHIQEMSPAKGPVVVFVEELGEKCTVPFDNLEPLPKSEKPAWPSPYNNCQHLAAVQQKVSALPTSESAGNKWKKSKVGKTRKVKDDLSHSSFSPCLQYCSKINSSGLKYSSQVHPRMLQERTPNIGFQKLSPGTLDRFQNYNQNIVHMDMPDHSSLILEQTNTSNTQLISQHVGMTLSSSSSPLAAVPNNNMMQTEAPGRNSPEGRASSPTPPAQPDSTVEISSAEVTSSIGEISDTNVHSMNSCSQFMNYTPYTHMMQASVPKAEVTSTASRPAGIINMPILPESYCPQTNASPYMFCSPAALGTNQSGNNTQPGTADQSMKEQNGTAFFQPVNFTAQKSVQPNGSDLPLTDLPTLRFYYNLGHDYFRMKCLCWQEAIPQLKMQPSLVQMPYASPIGSSNLDGNLNVKMSNDTSNPTLPDSTTNFQDEMLHANQEAAHNSPFSNDHNLFVKSIEKPSLNKCGIIHEPGLWQNSQNGAEIRCFPNPFRDCGKGIKNSTEEDDEKVTNSGDIDEAWNEMAGETGDLEEQYPAVLTANVTCGCMGSKLDHFGQVRRFEQNVVRLQEPTEALKLMTQPNENAEAGNELNRGDKAQTQGGTSVMYTGYNMALPYSYPTVSPTFYNNTVYPMLVPLETEQGIIPVPMYPSYSVGTTTIPPAQEAVESTTTAENQCSTTVCTPVQHSTVGLDNSCMQSYTFYTQPPAPLLFPGPSLSPQAGVYSGIGQMQRWVQPNVNGQAAPCMYPSQTPLSYTSK